MTSNASTFAKSCLFAILLVGIAALPTWASAYHTNFQGNCNNTSTTVNPVKRSTARAYAHVARNEGYQWGGGCWNNNGVDDSPNDPVEDGATGGEGGDCSGFTFKSWYERQTEGDDGFREHDRMQNTHGPYVAAEFKNGDGAPNVTVGKPSTVFMDAFASTDHIGMIYNANTAAGTDEMIEAKSEADGTNIWSRTYRGSSSYSGVRRVGWLPECSPQCP